MDSTTDSENLAQTRHAWHVTYRALAAASPSENTPLRRQLLTLSTRMMRLREQPGSSGRAGMRAA